ncbi:MAG: transposase [Clostridia bacterium]|nr:transposase [Clostridia bacterium]
MSFYNRKATRLSKYNYSEKGAYFITICTQNRKPVLSKISIVGDGVLDVPENKLTFIGEIADKNLKSLSRFYKDISVDKYVIMPNHIHMLIQIKSDSVSGSSRTPTPTNMKIPHFISTFKRLCNKEYGKNIWQRSFHDHIIRNQKDYDRIWTYIEINPYKWEQDCFYKKGDISTHK